MIQGTIIGVLIVGFAALNVARGQGWFPSKVIAYALMALLAAAGFYLEGAWLAPDFARIGAVFAAAFAGLWFSFAFGWGKFFPTGWNTTPDGRNLYEEEEFAPAEFMANLIVGRWNQQMLPAWVKKWQTVAMTFRFLLTFTLVSFPVLAFATGDWKTSLCGLPMGLAGLAYRAGFIKHNGDSVKISEAITGALLGGCIALAVTV